MSKRQKSFELGTLVNDLEDNRLGMIIQRESYPYYSFHPYIYSVIFSNGDIFWLYCEELEKV